MELASIYLDETELDKNNKFTIKFLTTESDFNVYFNKNTICYVTNLDLNLVLDYEKITKKKNHHAKVIELSKLSNELISKSFNNTKFNSVKLKHFISPFINYEHKLYLNENIIDTCSYKYEFLDTTENKIKKCKIYDQYQHLKVGMIFENKQSSTYKINMTNDKLIKELYYDTDKIDLGFWSRYINSIVALDRNNNYMVKAPLYNRLYHLLKRHNIVIQKRDLFHQYYFKISLLDNKVICSEDIWNNELTAQEKQNIVFIALKNKKIRALKNKYFWLPVTNIRGNLSLSFANNLLDLGQNTFNETSLKKLRTADPNYPFTRFQKFHTGFKDIDLEILENDVQTFPSVTYDNLFFMTTDDLERKDIFRTMTGITLKRQIDNLSETKITNIKNVMSKDIDKIKQLVEEEKEVINSLKNFKKENELKQKQFYLYDNSNIIKPTLLTEINKTINLYGKMELQSTNIGKMSKLIKTEDSLKFQVSRSIFKEQLDFEIQNIVKEELIKTTDNKIHNITIIMVPQITKKYTLVDSIKIIGFSARTETLNPVSIIIENNDIINQLSRHRNYKFRLTLNSILLSSNIKNEDQVIHLNSSSLTDARYSLINHRLLKSLGQINLNEIDNFNLIKEKKAWLNCVLTDSKKVPYGSKHFSYSFITNKLVNILNFEIEFLNRKGERLEWEADEKRLPHITFTIDVLR